MTTLDYIGRGSGALLAGMLTLLTLLTVLVVIGFVTDCGRDLWRLPKIAGCVAVIYLIGRMVS